jgi:PPM family protein phosphatase
LPDAAHVDVVAITHVGRVRSSNEDSITVAGWVSDVEMAAPRRSRHPLTEPLLFVIADGLGGHAAGDVASRYAVKRLVQQAAAGGVDVAGWLASINEELYQCMRADASLLGMGTTIAGLLITETRAVWFNVGDSRIYCERDGRFEQLSIDDVPPGPRSGMITQTVGGSPAFFPITPHIGEQQLLLLSHFLLCSDGLTDMLADDEIERRLFAADGEEALRSLFAAAMHAGGSDNVSIILVSASR